MAGGLKESGSRRPIQPGDAEWLHLRAMHATLKRQIAERGLSDRELRYLRLREMIAEVKRSNRVRTLWLLRTFDPDVQIPVGIRV